MTTAALPIGVREAAGLLAGCTRPLAIGVSGGADSMALMHLVAMWRQDVGHGLPPPLVLTVDHGLRPESADEARFVADAASALGFAHETLSWIGSKPVSGIQEAARRARYRLIMDRLARDSVPRDLLLAHHLDDQAETLLMRLARGSGLDGLSAMRPVEPRIATILEVPVREVAVRLLRPLLDIPKDRLVATLQAAGAVWREDPSNVDGRFERVRLRGAGSAMAALGLTAAAVARSARRLNAERDAAIDRARRFVAGRLDSHGGAYGELLLDDRPPPADLVRVLARMLDVFGGSAPPAQLSQIETLAERVLQTGVAATGRLTLGGCIVEIADRAEGRVVMAFREPARTPLPTLTLRPGEAAFWDCRFFLTLDRSAQRPVIVGARSGHPVHQDGPRDHRRSLPALLGGDGTRLLWSDPQCGAACAWPMQLENALHWRTPASAAETI